jgi:hypothetical protein
MYFTFFLLLFSFLNKILSKADKNMKKIYFIQILHFFAKQFPCSLLGAEQIFLIKKKPFFEKKIQAIFIPFLFC